jgi:hypothetical protein
MFKYLHNGTYHTDTSLEYLENLGLNEDIIESILNQKAYESVKDIEIFKASRALLIQSSIVTVSSGKTFDADEVSINRLSNAIVKHLPDPDDAIIRWSTADVSTGVMVDCTKAEIVEAHKKAVEFVDKVMEI